MAIYRRGKALRPLEQRDKPLFLKRRQRRMLILITIKREDSA